MLAPPPDGFEDGTQSFLSIAQLQFGFAMLHKLGGVQVRGPCVTNIRTQAVHLPGETHGQQ